MMILPFNFTILILISSFVFLILHILGNKFKSHNKYKKLPPSPHRLPVIGHLHHLVGALPHQALATLARKYGPVMNLQLGELSTVVISSREAAKSVLKDQDPACASRPANISFEILWYEYKDIAFSPYNEYWRQMRKICILEMLSAKNVKSFGHIRQEEAAHLVDFIHLLCGQPINLAERIFVFSSSIVCRAVFGKVVMDRESLTYMIRRAFVMAGGFELADLFPSFKLLNTLCWNKYKLLRMHKKIDKILDSIVEEHKFKMGGEFGGEDIVDALLRIQKNKELEFRITNDNIKAIILDMFSAGTETSSTTVNFAFMELMRNPHVMAKAQAQVREAMKGKETIEESDIQSLKYIKLVIKETLRLHPPVALLPRACRAQCIVDEFSIPLNSRVMVNVWAMGRDPKYWHNPESFQPERFEDCSIDYYGNNFEYLPFGTGKRMCPGMNFGLVNVELPLAQLLYHFDWKLPQGMMPDDIDTAEDFGVVVTKKNPLLLIPMIHGMAT